MMVHRRTANLYPASCDALARIARGCRPHQRAAPATARCRDVDRRRIAATEQELMRRVHCPMARPATGLWLLSDRTWQRVTDASPSTFHTSLVALAATMRVREPKREPHSTRSTNLETYEGTTLIPSGSAVFAATVLNAENVREAASAVGFLDFACPQGSCPSCRSELRLAASRPPSHPDKLSPRVRARRR